MLVSAVSSGPHTPLDTSTLAPPMSATSRTIPSITSTSIGDSEHQSIVKTANDPHVANNTLSHNDASTSANTPLLILTHRPPDKVTQGDFVGGTGAAALSATSKKPRSTKMRPGTTTTARYVELRMKFIN